MKKSIQSILWLCLAISLSVPAYGQVIKSDEKVDPCHGHIVPILTSSFVDEDGACDLSFPFINNGDIVLRVYKNSQNCSPLILAAYTNLGACDEINEESVLLSSTGIDDLIPLENNVFEVEDCNGLEFPYLEYLVPVDLDFSFYCDKGLDMETTFTVTFFLMTLTDDGFLVDISHPSSELSDACTFEIVPSICSDNVGTYNFYTQFEMEVCCTDKVTHKNGAQMVEDINTKIYLPTTKSRFSNPVTDHLSFEVPALIRAGQITLFDLKGNALQQVALSPLQSGQTFILQTYDLPAGVYLLRLQSDDKFETHKVFKW